MTTTVAGELRTPSGRTVELDGLLGRGGEAQVHAVRGDPSLAVKLYAVADAERARKLAAMIARAPADPDRRAGHASIAWPRELVLDDEGRVAGFVMPRIDTRRYLPLHQLYHPRSRRSRAPGISWRYLVRIARNLCGTIAALHDADYVVGDLNESNVLVDDRALVTLVDLDSIQVTSGFRTFRCNVGKGEYTPPELQGRSFRETNRKQSSDLFGLAILVFLLLMEGNHPFSGSYRGEGEPPSLEANIRSRNSPYFGRSKLDPPLAAPPVELLGPELGSLLRRALLGQAWRRPVARELKEALAALEEELVQCDSSPAHAYGGHLDACPWCERAALLGSDPYPDGQRSSLPGTGNGSPERSGPGGGGALPAGHDRVRPAGHNRVVAGQNRVAAARGQVNASQGTAATGRDRRAAAQGTTTAGQGHWASAQGIAAAGGRLAPTTQPARNGARTARGGSGGPPVGGSWAKPAAATTSSQRASGANGAAARRARSTGTATPSTDRHSRGFRGTLLQFHNRLPLLSLSLLALFAAPAYRWEPELRGALAGFTANQVGQYGLLGLLVLLPALALSASLYRRARGRPEFARTLFVLERVARAAVAAGLISLLASLAAGSLLGRGSVLAGDWLLLPSFWAVAFVVSLRFVGPRLL